MPNKIYHHISYLWQGWQLLKSPALRPFLLIPILINVLLYSIAFIMGYLYLDSWVMKLIPDWISWLHWLIYPLFFVSFCVLGFFTFTIVANIIAAPFYAQLAAKTLVVIHAAVDDNTPQHSLFKIWQAELSRTRYILTRTLLVLLLFVIPAVNLAAPFVWLLFSAWCIALEYFAFPLENKGILFGEQKKQLQTMKWSALIFGSFVMFGLSIPVLNIVIAPVAVIAATLCIHAETAQN
jgi:CysZ protein